MTEPIDRNRRYESMLKSNPSNVEGIHYLAIWHLERQSYQQARKYFTNLTTLLPTEPEIWLSLCVCCALSTETEEGRGALQRARELLSASSSTSSSSASHPNDPRILFCEGLLAERDKDLTIALDKYNICIALCQQEITNTRSISIFGDLKGDASLRIAIVQKDLGQLELAMQMCSQIAQDPYSPAIRANALCLKGLLHEAVHEYPAAEVDYRSALQLAPGHTRALDRLGRTYLRYRETIPAAVQCFIKAVEVDPTEHSAWYLLGRCYMGTAQYTDAFEAYNRAANLDPNDAQVWCSLGVLYYSFGQYRESLGMFCRAVKLDPALSDAWYNIGALYDMCDQPEDAQKAYVKAKECGLSERFTNQISEIQRADKSNSDSNTKDATNDNIGSSSNNNNLSIQNAEGVSASGHAGSKASTQLYPQPVNYPESTVLSPLILPGGQRGLSLP